MRTVEVSVTSAHIGQGIRRDGFRCPVALAITEVTGDLDVEVEEDNIGFWVDGRFEYVRTPEEVAFFADEFDDGLPVQPFTFTLEVPDAVGVVV
jgi:hypothetical protein